MQTAVNYFAERYDGPVNISNVVIYRRQIVYCSTNVKLKINLFDITEKT